MRTPETVASCCHDFVAVRPQAGGLSAVTPGRHHRHRDPEDGTDLCLAASGRALAACRHKASARRPAVLLVGLVVLAAMACSAGMAGCGAGDETEPVGRSSPTLQFEIVDGEPVGGVQRISVSLGDRVTVEVAGDSEDQVHVHGYDLFVDLVDGEGTLAFDALIPGVFEIELEGSGRLIAELTVR